jgi:hypothetical protein
MMSVVSPKIGEFFWPKAAKKSQERLEKWKAS